MSWINSSPLEYCAQPTCAGWAYQKGRDITHTQLRHSNTTLVVPIDVGWRKCVREEL